MELQFNIGDTVWFVQAGSRQVYIPCPDCFGQQALTVILGDGTHLSIDCDCCREGYLGSQGKIKEYQWAGSVESSRITGIQLDSTDVRYGLHTACPEKVFATREEAETELVEVVKRFEAEEARRMNYVKDTKNPNRSWAWHVRYHQREIKNAEKTLAYHTAKLAVAKVKAKEPVQDEKEAA